MKKVMVSLIAVALMSTVVSAMDVPGWTSFVIRNGGSPLVSPAINDIAYGTPSQPAKEFVINASGMKAAWSTNALNGITVGQITKITIDRLNPSVPQVNAPYFNIWITDGNGKYAIIANEPSNPEWAGDSEWNITSWSMLSDKTLKVYEVDGAVNDPTVAERNTSWVHQLVNKVGQNLIFVDIANIKIQAPTVAELNAGWTGLGTGAPRELGTNIAYGFNWVFGDTLSNYVTVSEGYIVANPTVIPEPATLAILALGGLLIRRKKAN